MQTSEDQAQLARYWNLVSHYHRNPQLHIDLDRPATTSNMSGPSPPTDRTPLLAEHRTTGTGNENDTNPDNIDLTGASTNYIVRRKLRWLLTSKYAHYFVLILVALDVAGIFADFLVSLHLCSLQCPSLKAIAGAYLHAAHGNLYAIGLDPSVSFWTHFKDALGVLSLVFSCLFMVELLLSLYAFGPRYFNSLLHIVDSVSIVASFLVDVLSHGVIEEAGSLIIVLRLFRVFKIIEESGTAAGETFDGLQERIRELEIENSKLRRRNISGAYADSNGA